MTATSHPLDLRLAAWLEQLNQLIADQKAQGIEATAAMVRDSLAGLTATFVTERPAVDRVIDITVSNADRPIPVRLYDPVPSVAKPVCLFFHGGGHMAGSVEVYDPIARKLAQYTGQLVVSVDYRLAPETPYPGGLDDCLAVTRTLWETLARHGVAAERSVTLIGDSGGGTFAATVAARLADNESVAIHRLVLIYPSLDYTLSFPSILGNGQGFLLEQARIGWYFDHYFQHGEDRRQASPLWAPLPARMPATLVIAAGYCPLRDEGVAFAGRLQEAGIPCQLHEEHGAIHAYLNLENLVPDTCQRTYQRIADFLARP